MRITLETINNEVIKPVKLPTDDRKIKGFNVCSEPYANIALVAKKKSGKSQAVFYMLKKCAGKNTKIYAFVSTLYKDATYAVMRKYFKKKKIEFIGHQSMKDENGNILSDIVSNLQAEAEEEADSDSEEEEESGPVYSCYDLYKEACRLNNEHCAMEESEEQKASRPPKYLAPDYIFLFDDLSSELKSPALETLLKSNRHYKCKTIISTQYIHDIRPEALKQMDIWILFKGQPIKKLEKIYQDADISIPFELFVQIYKNATKKKYSFLYIDTRNDKFRKNFSTMYNIPDSDDEYSESKE